jgi:ABC-type lipoprotein export system ATPase subunit
MLSGGIQLRGLSGGERKRLAIACGVVAKPSLVFLDEPTSGLDSFAALNVVLFLKNMASQNGGTLIASLHQPRSAIWGQLDQVRVEGGGVGRGLLSKAVWRGANTCSEAAARVPTAPPPAPVP